MFVLVFAGAVVAAPTAHAADLPTGTFKLVNTAGGCGTYVVVSGIGAKLGRFDCGTLDLQQQFVYDLLTKQIRPVINTDKCLEAYGDSVSLSFQNCDNSVPGQKWERITAVTGINYNVRAYNSGDRVLSAAGVDFGSTFGMDVPVDRAAPVYTWTFPLV